MKYIIPPHRPPALWVSATDAPEGRPTCEVFETDFSPVPTGLVDAKGTPIYRLRERAPIGFCR